MKKFMFVKTLCKIDSKEPRPMGIPARLDPAAGDQKGRGGKVEGGNLPTYCQIAFSRGGHQLSFGNDNDTHKDKDRRKLPRRQFSCI